MSPLDRRTNPIALLVFCLCFSGYLPAAEIDFESEILPLFQERCLDCHGEETAEANLRLDTMAFVLRGGDSGEATVRPGDAMASYLLQRVTSENDEERMPPDGEPLDEDEVARLRMWIDQADAWENAKQELETEEHDHWSFKPIARVPIPIMADGTGDVPPSGHPIDRFIDVKLTEKQLHRSPDADKRKLIRRLYLVMHGLPPAPERIEQFLADQRSDAWNHLVDEVLESPRYGERLAPLWLDLVHFGETHGFETNRERPNAWRYRDWVIDAFNSDLPYDEFVRAQIAGDQFGYPEATGFLVAGPHDIVKGQDPLLSLVQRQDELTDMINTTGTAFLGLTLGCARCHNHKFDPVTQTDFYAIQALFAGVNHADRPLPVDPAIAQQRDQWVEEIERLTERLVEFTKPYPNGADESPPPILRPAVSATLNEDTFKAVDARFVRFTIERTNQSEPCIDELEIFSGQENVALASKGAKPTSSGDFVHPLHKLEHINDGKFGNPNSWISNTVSGGWVQIEFPKVASVDRVVWARDRGRQFADRIAIAYRIEASLDGINWVLCASEKDREPFSGSKPSEPVYYFDSFPEPMAKVGRDTLEQLNHAKQKLASLEQTPLVYAGTFSQPGPTYRLYRGEANAPREQVSPGVPRFLQGFQLDDKVPEAERRKLLAEWISNPENPLTARVIVNRLWQHHFGSGIVDTPSDFGINGTSPTHPELLDFLASELIDSGWSLKHIQRLILTSQTWRQDSRPNPKALAADGDSRFLWRYPPRRLDAESIRDCLLATTGVLDLRMGGPGFSAFEVDLENVRHYFPKKSFGPDDWRRMVYMTKVRQEKDAVFGVFDCPDFSQVVAKRSRSTTPLQALNLLNSNFVLQQSRLLVERLESERESPEGRVQLAFELCFGRSPEEREVASSLEFIEETDWVQFARALLNTNEFVFIP